MAAFVKSIAPMQLLGVGDEGFATSLNTQDSAALVASNPGLRPTAAEGGSEVDLAACCNMDSDSKPCPSATPLPCCFSADAFNAMS